jgi:hypothetical protein
MPVKECNYCSSYWNFLLLGYFMIFFSIALAIQYFMAGKLGI